MAICHSEFFWIKVKWFSEFHFTAKVWVFKFKMRFRMAGGDKKFQPPFFLSPFLSTWKNHPCYFFVKLVDSKAFTTFLLVCKKHTQTQISDCFATNFVWNLSEFWVFLKVPKIKVLFVSAWLLTKMQFHILPSMGEVTKTERVFIFPHFCLENLPSKILPR